MLQKAGAYLDDYVEDRESDPWTVYSYYISQTGEDGSFESMQMQTDLAGGKMRVGDSGQLTAAYTLAGIAADVTWTSDNPDVLTVDEDGTVTAVSNGIVTVTAEDALGRTTKMDVYAFAGDPNTRISGDVDLDSSVGLLDVVKITRTLAGGWNERIYEINADVNTDGEINLKDAVLIRRYLAGGWNIELK